MVKLKNKKLESSTLIEVIVGLVIITITFGIVFRLFVNVNRSENIRLKCNASLLMDKIINSGKADLNYIDEDFDYGYMTIEKTVIPYNKSENLKIMHLKAFDRQKKLILEKKEIILENP